MTHDELVQKAAAWLKRENCGVVFDDRFRGMTTTGEQPDAIGWRHEVSILVECKTSRADFLADRKKPFRVDPTAGMGDWRFMMCPPGLISPEELPDGWGLLYAHNRKIQKVHGVPTNAQWRSHKPFNGNTTCETQLMYAALRRMQIRGHLKAIYEPLSAVTARS